MSVVSILRGKLQAVETAFAGKRLPPVPFVLPDVFQSTADDLVSGDSGRLNVMEVVRWCKNIWLTQKRMAELFGVDVSTINEHLKNIYKTGELQETATIGKFPMVQ